MNPSFHLFNRFPDLEQKLPRHELTQLPTPVTEAPVCAARLDADRFYIKRDDLTGETYGGNKVRKLEFLLGKALADGVKEVVTFGYAGSNHALATAIYARKAGLKATSVLLPQPNAHYVRRNIRAAVAAGARLKLKPNDKAIAGWVTTDQFFGILRTGRRPMLIPAGGSSPVGVVGFINAGLELAEQVREEILEKPDRIYMPISSMGSAVGLYMGLQMAGLHIPIHAVRVVEEKYTNTTKLKKLLSKTNAFLHELDSNIPIISLDTDLLTLRHEYIGNGYAQFTEKGMESVRFMAEKMKIPFEGTYSGKAFSCAMDDGMKGELRGQKVLYWNTHNSRDFTKEYPLDDERMIPGPFRGFFEKPVQPLDRPDD
jgi:D-cysteine desulfhydrase